MMTQACSSLPSASGMQQDHLSSSVHTNKWLGPTQWPFNSRDLGWGPGTCIYNKPVGDLTYSGQFKNCLTLFKKFLATLGRKHSRFFFFYPIRQKKNAKFQFFSNFQQIPLLFQHKHILIVFVNEYPISISLAHCSMVAIEQNYLAFLKFFFFFWHF